MEVNKIYFLIVFVISVLLSLSSARPQAATPSANNNNTDPQNPFSLLTLPLQLPMTFLSSFMKG